MLVPSSGHGKLLRMRVGRENTADPGPAQIQKKREIS